MSPTAPSLCRVALLVGDDVEIDWALPAGVALIAVTEDLVDRVNDVLRQRGRPGLEPEHTYRLCRSDGRPLDEQKTLDECAVLDGEKLWLLPAEATERFEPVTEVVSTALARTADQLLPRMTPQAGRRVAGWLTMGSLAWAAVILVNWWLAVGGTDAPWGWVGAVSAWALMVVVLGAAWGLSKADPDTPAGAQRRAAGYGLSWCALVPAVAGAVMSVPGPPGPWQVAAGLVAVIAATVMLAAVWGRPVKVIAALLTMAVFGFGAALVAAVSGSVRPEHVAVVVLLGVIVAVTWASTTATAAAGIPTPLFPSITNRGVFEALPGQPEDSVSPVGPTGVVTGAQIRAWVVRGNNAMTGMVLGLAVVSVVAARYAVVPDQPGGWRYAVFVGAIAAILVLRARSFVDRDQSVALMVAGVGCAAVAAGRYAAAAATSLPVALVCAGVMLTIAVLGLFTALVTPFRQYTAPLRRSVEFLEYALLIPLFPWALWLLNVASVIRNSVRHGI